MNTYDQLVLMFSLIHFMTFSFIRFTGPAADILGWLGDASSWTESRDLCGNPSYVLHLLWNTKAARSFQNLHGLQGSTCLSHKQCTDWIWSCLSFQTDIIECTFQIVRSVDTSSMSLKRKVIYCAVVDNSFILKCFFNLTVVHLNLSMLLEQHLCLFIMWPIMRQEEKEWSCAWGDYSRAWK